MDLRKLKTLIDLVAESGISELEVSESDGTVRIVKAAPQIIAAPMSLPSQPAVAVAQAAPPAAPVAGVAPVEPAAPRLPDGHAVTSPMVGTLYRASSPGAAPFVNVGDVIKEGQTICIIEAMKLLNEIESDRAGVVKEILVENGQVVEFGQPLILIG